RYAGRSCVVLALKDDEVGDREHQQDEHQNDGHGVDIAQVPAFLNILENVVQHEVTAHARPAAAQRLQLFNRLEAEGEGDNHDEQRRAAQQRQRQVVDLLEPVRALDVGGFVKVARNALQASQVEDHEVADL